MTGRQIPPRVCRQAGSAALPALSLLALSLVSILPPPPLAGAATAVPAVPAATAPAVPLTVSLTAITPTVAVATAPITITGRIRNAGSVPVASPVARALLGQRPLASRKAVSDWAATTSEQPLAEVARAPLVKTLAAGASTAFTLTIPANEISHRDSFGVFPLRIDVVGTTPTTTQRSPKTRSLGGQSTFLPALARIKAYEPLSIAWLVPLTLDPDPALHGMDSPARTAAWAKAIGPGSRLDRLIQGTEEANVTWAIDPAILGPPQTPTAADTSATPSPAPSASNAPGSGGTATPDPVTEATAALAARLRAAAPRHTLWSLPYADPDLAAILPLPAGPQDLAARTSRHSALDLAVGPARTDIAWPVEGTLTAQSESQLKRAFALPGLAGAVTSASTLTSRNGLAGDATRKSSSGLPLLAYDEALSATVAQTSSRGTGAVTIQRFLADSMALLGERPGTRHRSVLIAEPRTFAGDPTVLRSFFAAIAKAPWLVTTTTDRLLEASDKADPEVTSDSTTGPSSPETATTSPPSVGDKPTAADPLSPGLSALTSDQLEAIPDTLSTITGISSILADGQLFRARWADAQDQLLSARWRGHPAGPTAIETATTAAIGTVSRHVNVSPSSVNFFADQGVLQVTVVNTLDVAIHDVQLTLTPAQPRLRIEQRPGPLRIGAKSRTNVKLQVTAIAAGLVRVEAALTTRNGTSLGQNASVDVRVQPTSTWIYWVLGGLGGLVLVLGTSRSLRRGSTRASRPEAREPALDD